MCKSAMGITLTLEKIITSTRAMKDNHYLNENNGGGGGAMEDTTTDDFSVIVVARHGERLDYYIRDHPYEMEIDNVPVSNWCSTAKHPFNPPLTSHGMEQAQVLGSHLVQVLKELNLPCIGEIYTSPLLRCRQTAINVRRGITLQQQSKELEQNQSTDVVTDNSIPIRVEIGLIESINNDWYRSWALPGSDGTWGYRDWNGYDGNNQYDKELIHNMAKVPIQVLLSALHDEYQADSTDSANSNTTIDTSYVSKTSIVEEYNMYHEKYETSYQQRDRMKQVVDIVTTPTIQEETSNNNKTIVLVSHGGPVYHLYESLTNDKVAFITHGEASYCSYSIYVKKNNSNSTNNKKWEAIRINQSNHIRDMSK